MLSRLQEEHHYTTLPLFSSNKKMTIKKIKMTDYFKYQFLKFVANQETNQENKCENEKK